MPEVVLMDFGMPNLNGYDAAGRIRQEPWGQEMMLIATTGWARIAIENVRQLLASTVT